MNLQDNFSIADYIYFFSSQYVRVVNHFNIIQTIPNNTINHQYITADLIIYCIFVNKLENDKIKIDNILV